MQQHFPFCKACKGSLGSIVCNRSCRLMAGGRKPGAALCDVPGSVVLFNMTRLPVSLFIFKIRYFSDFYHRSFLATSAKTLFPMTSAASFAGSVVIPGCQHSVLPSHTVSVDNLAGQTLLFPFCQVASPTVSCTAGTGKAGTRVRSSGPFSCPSLLSICYTLVSCLSVIPQPNSSLPSS